MNQIQRFREKELLTRAQLADKLQVTEGTIYNWEIGKSKPRKRSIAKLSEVFKVEPDIFLS